MFNIYYTELISIGAERQKNSIYLFTVKQYVLGAGFFKRWRGAVGSASDT